MCGSSGGGGEEIEISFSEVLLLNESAKQHLLQGDPCAGLWKSSSWPGWICSAIVVCRNLLVWSCSWLGGSVNSSFSWGPKSDMLFGSVSMPQPGHRIIWKVKTSGCFWNSALCWFYIEACCLIIMLFHTGWLAEFCLGTVVNCHDKHFLCWCSRET